MSATVGGWPGGSPCAACQVPTDTVLGLSGDAEVIAYGLVRLGVPEGQAVATVLGHAQQQYGYDYGQVPDEEMEIAVSICVICGMPAGMTPRLVLADRRIPVYRCCGAQRPQTP